MVFSPFSHKKQSVIAQKRRPVRCLCFRLACRDIISASGASVDRHKNLGSGTYASAKSRKCVIKEDVYGLRINEASLFHHALPCSQKEARDRAGITTSRSREAYAPMRRTSGGFFTDTLKLRRDWSCRASFTTSTRPPTSQPLACAARTQAPTRTSSCGTTRWGPARTRTSSFQSCQSTPPGPSQPPSHMPESESSSPHEHRHRICRACSVPRYKV